MRTTIFASAALALTPLLVAQDQLPAGDLRVPVHTAAADPAGGAYGLWAMGPTFKAAFHDGFRFVPLLGRDAPHNLPIHWRTAAVTCGAEDLLGSSRATSHTDWRVEMRSGAVVEAYDVREDGVEQTFTIDALPDRRGPLVVTASLETPLAATEQAPRHGALTFVDHAGRAILEYGAGVAFDAVGRRVDVRTAYEGGLVHLIVDESFVAEAVLPITIDPLVRTVIADSSSLDFEFTDVVRDDETDELFYVYSVAASAGDLDQFGWISNDDLNGATRVFTDITDTWSATHGRITFVGGADRYAMAMQRQFPVSNTVLVRAYLHDKGARSVNSGRTLFITPPSGIHLFEPAIGGVHGGRSGTTALLTYRREDSTFPANTNFSRVRAAMVDCTARTLGNEFGIGGDGTTIDAEAPSVNRLTGGGNEPWVVTWQEHGNASGPWRLLARQVFPDGSVTTHLTLDTSFATHAVRGKVDGAFGRYMAAWVVQPNSGTKRNSSFGFRIDARRFEWPANGTPTRHATVAIAEHPTLQNLQLDAGHPIAYDTDTDSHWMVAWAERNQGVFAARIGFDGQASERATLRQRAAERIDHPSVCYDDDAERFVASYISRDSLARVRIAEIAPLAASQSNFGPRCPARLDLQNNGDDLPLAGSEFTELVVGGAPANVPVFVVASGARAPTGIPLPSSPAGCLLMLDPATILGTVAQGTTSNSGTFLVDTPLPSSVEGTLFLQAILLSGNDLLSSEGLELVIR